MSSEKPLAIIYTEGKTDWKHLMKKARIFATNSYREILVQLEMPDETVQSVVFF